MADRITANLPSADFDRTEAFYGALGFTRDYRDDGWMILRRGPLELEFFPMDINPKESWFSACFRVDDLDGLHAAFSKAKLPDGRPVIARLDPAKVEPHGVRIFYFADADGSLIRCLDNLLEP